MLRKCADNDLEITQKVRSAYKLILVMKVDYMNIYIIRNA